MDYQELLDTLMNLADNSPIAAKKNALRDIATALHQGGEPDFRLRIKAIGTIAALNAPELGDDEIREWINAEIADYKNELEKKIADAPQEDVEMAQGGRKRRRAKKTKSKTKKSRRYTRRR